MLNQNEISAALLKLADTSTPEIALSLVHLADAVMVLPVITDEDLAQARLIIEQDPDTQKWLVRNDRDGIVDLPTRTEAARAGLRLIANVLRSYRMQYG